MSERFAPGVVSDLVARAIVIILFSLMSANLFGDFGGEGRGFWNPAINSFLQWFGQPLEALPPWPLYETIVGTLLLLGAIYYVIAVRGRAPDVEADVATGEATIG